jgi:hypothetical protein
MSMRLGTRSSRHGFSRSWNIEESNTRSSKASANICGSGPHGLVAPSCLAKRILSKRRSSRRRRLLIGPSPLKRSDLSRPSHRIEKPSAAWSSLGLRRRNRWIKDPNRWPAPPRGGRAHSLFPLGAAQVPTALERRQRPLVGTYCSRCGCPVMKPTPVNSEKKAAIVIWIGTIVFVFTIGAMIFGD